MLELIFQGFIEWVYSLVLECWNFFSASLLDIMSLDLAYIRSHVPIIGDIMQVLLAVGWALLLGNLVFQALKSMAAGLGFEAEDPKMLFGRSAVFSFLLLASPQICEIALNMTSRIITLLDLPNAIDVHLVDAGIFGNLLAGWLVVIVCNIVIMCRVLKLLLKIAEQYVILSTLTIAAPLAFSMGGSKSTSAIFSGWCRMYGSMCLLMVSNVIFFKMLLSVMSAIPSGLDVFPWMVLIFSIVKVAKRMDDTITRIGLNPAQTGAQGGRSFPGMLAATVMHGAVSQVTKTIGGAVGGTVGGVLGGAGRGAAAAGRTFAGGAAAGLGTAARPGGGRNAAPRTDSRQAYTQQNSTQQASSQQDQASTANTQQSAFQQSQAGTGAPQRPAGGQNQPGPGTGSARQPASRPNPSGAANTQQAASRQNQPPAAGTQQSTFQQFPASQTGGANTPPSPMSTAGRNGGRAFRYSRNTSVPYGMRRSPSYVRDADGPPSGRAGTGADFRAGGSHQDTPEGSSYSGRAGGRSTGGVPRSGVDAPHSGSFGGGSRGGGFQARRAGAVSKTASYEHSASSVTERTASFGGADGGSSIPGRSLRADSPAAGAAGRGRSPTARPAVDKMSGSAAGARSRNSAGTPAAPRSGTAGTGSPAAASGQRQEGPGSSYGGHAARSTKVTGRERSQRPAVSAGAAAAPPAKSGRGQHTHSTESRSTHRTATESKSVTTTTTARSASRPDTAGTPAKVRQPAQTPPSQVIPPAAGAQPPKRARSSPARQEARPATAPARSPAQRDIPLSRPGTAGTAPEARRPAREAETAKRPRDKSMPKIQEAPGIKRQPVPPASAGKKPQPKQPDRSGRGGGHE